MYSQYIYWNTNSNSWAIDGSNVHLGNNAGLSGQTGGSVAIGTNAGVYNQNSGIAIGATAGFTGQNIHAVAIGNSAQQINGGTGAIAIGYQAGNTGQGQYAIAIGYQAGASGQNEKSIVLNATGNVLNAGTTGFFVDPIREASNNYYLQYNTNNKEITYNLFYIDSLVENVGCNGNNASQQNIIIEPSTNLSIPENMVLRSFGEDTVYGNFIRDDILTTIKGNIRGSGSVDLSVFRNSCNQVASGSASVISGGENNTSSGTASVVSGGRFNIAGDLSVVSGGEFNSSFGQLSVVSGGQSNSSFNFSVVSGGVGNSSSGNGSVVSGGVGNIASGSYSVVSGGEFNSSFGQFSVVVGGTSNIINTDYCLAAGLGIDLSNSAYATAFGVYNNDANFSSSGYGFTGSGLTDISFSSARRFMIGNGSSNVDRSNLFSVTENGYAIASTGFIVSSGADFAEYMESKYEVNGTSAKIPIGISVVLSDQGFIIPSDTLGLETKNVIGVISSNSSLISNASLEEWDKKYIKNNGVYIYEEEIEYEEIQAYEVISEQENLIRKRAIYQEFNLIDSSDNIIGSRKEPLIQKVQIYEKEVVYQDISKNVQKEVKDNEAKTIKILNETIVDRIIVMETHEIVDESDNIIQTKTIPKTTNGKIKKKYVKKLNPEFNPNLTYIPRPQRPEWNLVGFLGQVYIQNGQRINPNWIKIKEIPETNYSLWLIK